MPQIPRYQAREGVPSLRLPRPGTGQFGGEQFEALGELAETYRKIDRLNDGAESSQRAQNINAEIEEAIRQSQIENANNPDIFESHAQGKAQEIITRGLEAAPNDRVRDLIQFKLGDNLPKRRVQIQDTARKMRIGNAKVKWDTYRDNLAVELETESDPMIRAQKEAEYEVELRGSMLGTGAYTPEQAAEDRRKLLKGRAHVQIDADASRFLGNLQSGKFDSLSIEDRLALKNSANATISSSITVQNREQKVKQEAADRQIQMMVDAGERPDIIQNRLQELTASGIFDRQDRKFWDDYLTKDNKVDSPAQTANALAFEAEFGGQGYPSYAAVSKARAKLHSMRNNGEIGVKGAGKLFFMLNRTEHSLRTEGRAMESAARARAGGTGGKMSNAAALALIQQNYPYSPVTKPNNKQHQKDVQEYTTRVLMNDEDRATVAKEVYTRGKELKQKAEQTKSALGEAARADPAKKELLDRLKELKTRR